MLRKPYLLTSIALIWGCLTFSPPAKAESREYYLGPYFIRHNQLADTELGRPMGRIWGAGGVSWYWTNGFVFDFMISLPRFVSNGGWIWDWSPSALMEFGNHNGFSVSIGTGFKSMIIMGSGSKIAFAPTATGGFRFKLDRYYIRGVVWVLTPLSPRRMTFNSLIAVGFPF